MTVRSFSGNTFIAMAVGDRETLEEIEGDLRSAVDLRTLAHFIEKWNSVIDIDVTIEIV